MDGICINGVTLYLTRMSNRKGYCFCFDAGTVFLPVAYVRQKNLLEAVDMWQTMLDGIPGHATHKNLVEGSA